MKRLIKNIIAVLIISIVTLMSATTALAFEKYEAKDKEGNDILVETVPAENGERVFDEAGIFTQEEKNAIEDVIKEIRENYGRDVVVVTNNSSGEKDKKTYAGDFWAYGNYGCGDEHEGLILYIDMDPENRGWCTNVTGSDSNGEFGQGLLDAMDKGLSRYFADEEYGEGVLDWVNEVGSVYKTGLLSAPEWYPDRGEEIERYNNPDPHEVDDQAGMFTEEQKNALAEKARAISEKYGIDVAITTTDNTYGMIAAEYGDEYYKAFGIGYGPDYDGILLTIFPVGYTYIACGITAEGKGLEKLSDVNRDRLYEHVSGEFSNGNYYEGAEKFLDNCEHMMRTGRVPKTAKEWIIAIVVGLILGAIAGIITLILAKKKMAVPTTRTDATAYLAAGSLAITAISTIPDVHVGTDVSRELLEYEKHRNNGSGSSGSSWSSGGGSTYTPSFEDSSGMTHSSSERSF